VLRVGQGELDERAEVGVDVANVEPALRGRQTESEHAAATLDEQADAVGQLDFTALAGGGVLERVEDLRRQHVARRDRQRARRIGRPGLLDEVLDTEQPVGRRPGPRDAVVADLRSRNFLERHDGTGAGSLERHGHPLHHIARRVQADDRIAERHHERVRSDERPRAEDGVSETAELPLPRVEELRVRALVRELFEQILLAGLPQRLRQLRV
jgi:hypothetical protein